MKSSGVWQDEEEERDWDSEACGREHLILSNTASFALHDVREWRKRRLTLFREEETAVEWSPVEFSGVD